VSDKIRGIIQQVQNETLYEGRYTEEDRLVAAVEAARAEAKAEGVMEERHKCLADMCWMCGKNYPVHKVVVDDKVIWMHPRTRGGRYGAPCAANPIRLRWAKE
jgi:hypothetical protein